MIWASIKDAFAAMAYKCSDCGSDTRVIETRLSSFAGTPLVVRRLAQEWGGAEETWVCRRRYCTNSECRHKFWTAEMEINALKSTVQKDTPEGKPPPKSKSK